MGQGLVQGMAKELDKEGMKEKRRECIVLASQFVASTLYLALLLVKKKRFTAIYKRPRNLARSKKESNRISCFWYPYCAQP